MGMPNNGEGGMDMTGMDVYKYGMDLLVNNPGGMKQGNLQNQNGQPGLNVMHQLVIDNSQRNVNINMMQQQQQQPLPNGIVGIDYHSNRNYNFQKVQLPAQPKLPANIELQPVHGDNKMQYSTKRFMHD